MTNQATITILPSLGNRPSVVSRTRTNTHILESPFHGTSCYSGRLSRLPARAVRFHVLAPPRLGNQSVKFNRRRGLICRLPFLGGGAFHSPASNLDACATRNLRLLDRYAHQQAYTRCTNTAADHAPSLHPIVRITPIHTRKPYTLKREHRDSSLSRIIRRRTKVELLTQKTTE